MLVRTGKLVSCLPLVTLALLAAITPLTTSADEGARVAVARAEKVPLVESLSLTGSLSSPQSARLAGEVEGRVRRIEVEAGDRVSAGDTLVVLDDELDQLELAEARALRRVAAADLSDAERRLREARDLAERDSVAASEVESRKAAVQRNKAVLERRRAQSRYRQAVIERHTLEAPFDGVITERLVDLGEWITPGEAMLTLVASDPLRLELQVPQGYFGRVTNNTEVAFRVEALGDEEFNTTVNEIVPATRPGTRTFPVRARIDNGDGRLAPGMSVRARLHLPAGREGVVVPEDALIRHPDGRVTVWIVGDDDGQPVARERQIDPGLSFDGRVAVGDTLDSGTRVVVRGNESLSADQPLQITTER